MDYTVQIAFMLTALKLKESFSQQLYECPEGWVEDTASCYLFVHHPAASYRDAKTACQMESASLLRVTSAQENTFVTSWLQRHSTDKSRPWLAGDLGLTPDLRWESTGSPLTPRGDYWLGERERPAAPTERVVFSYDKTQQEYRWSLAPAAAHLPYVCEVGRREAYRILQQARDFLFGTNETDPNKVDRGPRFVKQPSHVVVGTLKLPVILECEAEGRPQPIYQWFKLSQAATPRPVSSSDRVTITNGKMTIHTPAMATDAGSYQCVATNKMGAVVSDPGTISFGNIADFSNDVPGAVRANLYQGVVISCDLPNFSPAVNIKWYKEKYGPNFLRTDLHPNQFVSLNGRLYFSETSPLDAGTYHCSVTLEAGSGRVMSSPQYPSRTSKGIRLVVSGQAAASYQPDIHNDFPAVYPTPPMLGRDMTLECFAYGLMPLRYTWTKDGGPIPARARLHEQGRVLHLEDARLEDAGDYTCRAARDSRIFDEKTLQIRLDAVPYFPHPLRDQHLDTGSQLTWRCQATAFPRPVYSWLKNGKPLVSVPNVLEVKGNVLFIAKADPDLHPGMYQCSATNIHGTSLSSAQLRVLAFAPTFAKSPVNPSQLATIGGSVTLACRPEAAPRPAIHWLKNDRQVPDTQDPQARVAYLSSGDLRISRVQLSDQGSYTCVARNPMGSAHSSGLLTAVARTVIHHAPTDERVEVNGTAFLACQASRDRKLQDLVYLWSINGRPINTTRDPHYAQSARGGVTGLYIVRAQLRHTGHYTCSAVTVDDVRSHGAWLEVLGPPGECVAVRGFQRAHTVNLTWLAGPDHGAPIQRFVLEFRTDFNPEWRRLRDDAQTSEACDLSLAGPPGSRRNRQRRLGQCRLLLTDLKPGSTYSFRVIGVNRYGPGPASLPSSLFKIPNAAPIVPVTGIREGLGPVGTLPIVWDALALEDLTGTEVGYTVYFRRKKQFPGQWTIARVTGRTNRYAALVGAENFFLEYQVMVAAFNSNGTGPNSTVHIVMSAEDVPVGAPTDVSSDSYNATAMMVYWTPVPNVREFIRGNVLGYQVNYWSKSLENPEIGSTNIYCDCGEGLVVGLDMNDDFVINVQVFTNAGIGPLSEEGEGGTYIYPPLHYPEFVKVSSFRGNAVFVFWRDVTTGLLEEPVAGYKLRWWPASDNILSANDTLVAGGLTHGVIRGLDSGVVYALRVLGYSAAGDGKKSPTVYFTIEGQVRFNPETSELMNGAQTARPGPPAKTVVVWFILALLTVKVALSCRLR